MRMALVSLFGLVIVAGLAASSCNGIISSSCPYLVHNGSITANATRVVANAASCEQLSVNVTLPNGTLVEGASSCSGGLHNYSFTPMASGNYNITFYACSNQSSCQTSVLQWTPARRVPELHPLAVIAAVFLVFGFLNRPVKALK